MDFQKVRQIKRKGAIIVKKEFLTSNAKFVYSKNELGYQEVLDRFKDAKQITIITFNISEKQNTLVNALKKAGDSCIINVILIELSEFDSGEFVNQQLQKEYAMEAYEENLENCINSASEDAQNIVLDLTQTAKDDIDKLLSELQEYCDKYANFIDNLRAREIKKISPKIDNT